MYLPGQLLTKIDRTSMMHSLEARSPFLDTKLAEYVYNLPTKFKVTKTKSKVILKDILAETFPESFVYRRKQGFGAPVESWLIDPRMRAMTNDLLDNDSNMYDYIDKREVLIVKEKFYAGDKKNAHKLWILLTLALWFRTHQR
jgi:asparagine synthase (glutamine-hydrolysing)